MGENIRFEAAIPGASFDLYPERESEGGWQDEIFNEGDEVEYYSQTQGNKWINAIVKKVYKDVLELDVKKKAARKMIRRREQPADRSVKIVSDTRTGYSEDGLLPEHLDAEFSRQLNQTDLHSHREMREIPSPTHAANSAKGCEELKFDSDDKQADKSLFLEPSQERRESGSELQFKAGDLVMYNSQSLQTWIPAVVKGVNVEKGTYDLDCKTSAKADLVRARQPEDKAEEHETRVRVEEQFKDIPPVQKIQPQVQLPLSFKARQPAGQIVLNSFSPTASTASPSLTASTPSPSVSSAASSPAASSSQQLPSCGFRRAAQSEDLTPSARQVTPSLSLVIGAGITDGRRASQPAPMGSLPVQQASRRTCIGSPPAPVLSGRQSSDLRVTGGIFDPNHPTLKSQLLMQMRLSDSATIEEMSGFKGGLNEGVWFLNDGHATNRQEFVLKLVKCHRIASNILTEAENLEKLRMQHPGLLRDATVAFPVRVFSCMAPTGKSNDLIVMKKVSGERFSEYICRKFHQQQIPRLASACEKIGRELAEFHARYGNVQHGDFQPSNVFFDEVGDQVSFIDIGGMGVPTTSNDVDHFKHSIGLLARGYAASLPQELLRAFERGYASRGQLASTAQRLVR